ncbi:hypothetical protein [Nitrososphaera sp.]|uniref:hypothetical protein n=1 Tax=Nitrososphaera sp. TaxID=1971748 RepID=UPI00307F3B21
MKTSGKAIAFVVLAFVIGATISQGSFAFADESPANPFRAIWEAISELQTKTDSLQRQIDDLREQQRMAGPDQQLLSQQAPTKISESSIAVEVSGGQAGQTLVSLALRNAGPENAVGVKVSTYYQPALLKVNFIEGAECSDQARGIIECYMGTLDAGSETRIVIDATPVELGQQAIITADISSITKDADPTNNHAESVFITSATPVFVPPAPPVQEQEGQQPATVTEQPQGGEQGQEQQQQPAEQSGQEQEQPQGGEEQSGQPPQEGAQQQEQSSSGGSSGEAGTQGSEGSSSGSGADNSSSNDNNSSSSSGSGSESGSSETTASGGSESSSSSPGGSEPSSGSGESGGTPSPPPATG